MVASGLGVAFEDQSISGAVIESVGRPAGGAVIAGRPAGGAVIAGRPAGGAVIAGRRAGGPVTDGPPPWRAAVTDAPLARSTPRRGRRSSPACWDVSRSELRIRLLLVRPRTPELDRTLHEEVGRWRELLEARLLPGPAPTGERAPRGVETPVPPPGDPGGVPRAEGRT